MMAKRWDTKNKHTAIHILVLVTKDPKHVILLFKITHFYCNGSSTTLIDNIANKRAIACNHLCIFLLENTNSF